MSLCLVLPFGLEVARRPIPRNGSSGKAAGSGNYRFEPGRRLAPVREHEPLSLGDAAQDGLRVPTELEHGHGFHKTRSLS